MSHRGLRLGFRAKTGIVAVVSLALAVPAFAVGAVDTGSPTQLVFSSQPSDTAVGTAMANNVTVQAVDADNQVDTTFSGAVTLTLTTSAGDATPHVTAPTSLTTEAVGGTATFTGITIDAASTGYTLVATDDTVTAATSHPFEVYKPATHLAFAAQPSDTEVGAAMTDVTVQALNADGSVDAHFTAAVTLAPPSGIGVEGTPGSLTTNAVDGIATFSGLKIDTAGTAYTFDASADGLAGDTSSTFDIYKPATHVVFGAQPGDTPVDAAMADITVRALDVDDEVVTHFTDSVTLALNGTAGGQVSGAPDSLTTTSVDGVATFSALSIDAAGAGYSFDASSGTLTGDTSQAFEIYKPATHLAFDAQPVDTRFGVGMTDVTVKALDADDHVDSHFTGSVTIALQGGTVGAQVAGAPDSLTTNAVSGVATFSGLSIDIAGSAYQFNATSGTLIDAMSADFNVYSATHLVFHTQPSDVRKGEHMLADDNTSDRVIEVDALDASNQVDPNYRGAVTLSLTGTTFTLMTATAAGGIATFSPIIVNTAGSNYTLGASSPTLTDAAPSTAFNVYTATHLVFHTQPVDARSNAHMRTFGPATDVVVTVWALDDTSSLPDLNYRLPVTVALDGGNALGKFDNATRQQTLNASGGTASFTPIIVDTVGTGYSLAASAPTLTAASSNSFNVYSATHLVFSTQPVNEQVSAPMRIPGTTTLRDIPVSALNANNSVDANYTGPVVLTITGGTAGAKFINASSQHVTSLTVNAVLGVADFPSITIDTKGTGYQLSAASRDLTSSTSTSFIVSPPAAQLKFQVQPVDTGVNTAMQAVGAPAPLQITVGAYASDGVTPASYYDGLVSLGLTGGSSGAKFVLPDATHSAAWPVRAVNGVATFTPVIVDKTGFNYQLTESSATVGGGSLAGPASGKFLVAGSGSVCQTNGAGCSTNITNTGTNPNSASIKGTAGSNAFLITGTYGANVDAMACSKSAPSGELTFTGTGMKFITITIPAALVTKGAITQFCYGQPSTFLTSGFKQAVFYPTHNGGEYEGLLPPCAPKTKLVPPCIVSTTWSTGKPQVTVIESATSDPHIMN
jgi:hypothetical protein